MIAITGAAGRIGTRVATRLARLGVPLRLIVRDPRKAPQLPGAEVAQAAAYSDAVAMGKALSGIETMFLISASDSFGVRQHALNKETATIPYSREQEHYSAIDAAAAVGVKRIVYLSFLSAEEDATFILAKDHYHTEQYIRKIGLPFTFLRMNLYADNVAFYISDDGVIRVPAGEGKVSWVTRDDVADVATAVLTSSGHNGCTYAVTGPESLSMAETARVLTEAIGKTITYQMLIPHQARATHKISGFEKLEAQRLARIGTGFTECDMEVAVTHFMEIATGELSQVSDTVLKLTGHPAQSLRFYLKTHPESYLRPMNR